jgi:hypothetical protein
MKKIVVLLALFACGDPSSAPLPADLTVSGNWIGTTSNVTLRFEVGEYSQMCYKSEFGGTVCVQKAEMRGVISAGTETAAITGVATAGGARYASLDFWPERSVERSDTGCPFEHYAYVFRKDSGELTGNLISVCDGYTRTIPLVMRPTGIG